MIESFSISSVFDILTKLISVCFICLLIGIFEELLNVTGFRIGLKILGGLVLAVILIASLELHIGWTLFVIGVIISLSEKEIVYEAIYGDEVDSAIDEVDKYMQTKDYEDDLVKLEEMLNSINRDIGKLNVNLKESKYKEIKCNIYKGLSLIEELLENNYKLNDIEYDENKPWIYDRYSMIHLIVNERIQELPTPKFELKQQLEKQKIKRKINKRIDNMLTKIDDDYRYRGSKNHK